MEVTKLKLPPKEYRFMDSFLAEKRAGTFAHTFRAALAEIEDSPEGDLTVNYNRGGSKEDIANEVCRTVNTYHDKLREKLDLKMQEYLLAHNGVIDSWPDPASLVSRTFTRTGKTPFVFDYFGEDYVSDEFGDVARRSPDLIYRNAYKYPAKKPLQALLEKSQSLQQDAAAGKQNRAILPRLGYTLIFLYCVFGIISILGEVFWGRGQALVDWPNAWGMEEGAWLLAAEILWLVVTLPLRLYLFVLEFFPLDILHVIAPLAFLGFLLFWVYIFGSILLEMSKLSRKGRKAQKKLNALPASLEYQQASQEEEEEKRVIEYNEKLAEQWHRAWYQWACAVIFQAKE